MKTAAATAIVVAFGLLAPADATAAFIGVIVEPYVGDGWVENGYADLRTYRIYAEFDDPADGLLSVFGADRPIIVSSTDDRFHNAEGLDGLTAPQDLRAFGYWENRWDTYVTIGTDTADGDRTRLSDGFAEETDDLRGSFTTHNAGWFVTPPDGQGLPDEFGRVLLAQFTTAETEYPCQIELNLLVHDPDGNIFEINVRRHGACPRYIPPDGFEIRFGSLRDGTIDDLLESDDAYLEIRARPAVAPTFPSVAVEFEGTAFPGEGQLWFTVEAACDAFPSNVEQRLLLYDFCAGAWVRRDVRTATAGDSVVTVTVTGSCFTDEETGQVRARLEYHDPGGLVTPDWGARFDHVFWRWVIFE